MSTEINRRTALKGIFMAVPAAGLLSPALSEAAAPRASGRSDLQSRLGSIMRTALENEPLVGVGLGVSIDGRVAINEGFGKSNLELEVPVSPSTVFRIGSLTKQFTATAILLLQEHNLLKLEDPLHRFLPDFPRSRRVSLRQMLTHTSGIHNYVDGNLLQGRNAYLAIERSHEEMVTYIANQEELFDFEPGMGCAYSNSAYFLLDVIVERVAAMSLGSFLKENVFDPLKMRATAMDANPDVVPHRASGYNPDADAESGFTNAGSPPMSIVGGGGALRSTVGDLLTWHDALFSGRVLKPASLSAMIEPARMSDGRLTGVTREPWPPLGAFEFGMGQQLYRTADTTVVGHGGMIHGFGALLIRNLEQKTSVAILTNVWGGADRISVQVLEACGISLKQ